jgi:hypothetical protein
MMFHWYLGLSGCLSTSPSLSSCPTLTSRCLLQVADELTNKVNSTDNFTLLGMIRALHLRIHLKDLDDAAAAFEKPRVKFVTGCSPRLMPVVGHIT